MTTDLKTAYSVKLEVDDKVWHPCGYAEVTTDQDEDEDQVRIRLRQFFHERYDDPYALQATFTDSVLVARESCFAFKESAVPTVGEVLPWNRNIQVLHYHMDVTQVGEGDYEWNFMLCCFAYDDRAILWYVYSDNDTWLIEPDYKPKSNYFRKVHP